MNRCFGADLATAPVPLVAHRHASAVDSVGFGLERWVQRVARAEWGAHPDSRRRDGAMDTYNIYMDELPTGESFDGEEMVEVEFRVVPGSEDDGDAESNAVIAGLDLVDLINLRDALQQEIDNYALSALEVAAGAIADSSTS